MSFQRSLQLTRSVARYTLSTTTAIRGRTLASSSTATQSGTSASSQEKREAQQDRTAIDRQSDETSKSGTDDVVAAQSNISYSTSTLTDNTDPSELLSKAERQNPWSNPLHASPANTSMSDSTAEVESGMKTKKTVVISEEKLGTYRGKKKDGDHTEAGFEKKVWAGSTTGGKKKGADAQTPHMVQQGSR